ncbi:MAG: ECF transporter S component [Anaerorhabdus sp.]
MKKNKLFIIAALALALIFICTTYIKVPTQFGYVNLGDSMIFLFSSILPPSLSFLVSSVASGAADIVAGYPQYAIFTFIIKGVEALFVSLMIYKFDNNKILTYIGAGSILVLGYLITDWILYGSFVMALGGVVFNIVQATSAIIISALLVKRLITIIKNKI